ncbi:GNAT family N-acetyltransferase [Salsuginibacillus kocurii]|uniref:GNAT family N-acetyltransferase n=1 Tax=Salsuginibacillus kocurii TaxID=427078 RepID=UPI00037441C7|nr:GNAT family protein [Salsuginibacillus kocurii]
MQIELRPFTRDDFSQLIAWVDSPDLLLQWGGPMFTYPLDHEQLQDYLTLPDNQVYNVVQSETGRTVGHISLGKIDHVNSRARVGKVLVGEPSARGKKVGEQMMEKITQRAFEELGLKWLTLAVFTRNTPAIVCYEKAGFKKTACRLDTYQLYGVESRLWEMSLSVHDWREHRA